MRGWMVAGKALLGVIAVIALFVVAMLWLYRDKALPGTQVAGSNVGGKTQADIAAEVTAKTAPIKQITISLPGRQINLSTDQIGLRFDPTATAAAAQQAGHSGTWGWLTGPLTALGGTREVPMAVSFNSEALAQAVADQAGAIPNQMQNAQIIRQGTIFTIQAEQPGQVLDLAATATATQFALENGQSSAAAVIRPGQPLVTARSLQPARAYAGMLSNQPLTITAAGQQFRPNSQVLASWVTFSPQDTNRPQLSAEQFDLLAGFDRRFGVGTIDQPIATSRQGTLYADVSREQIGKYVAGVADEVDRPPVNARVSFANGQLSITGQPQDGLVVDRPAAVPVVADAVRSAQPATLPVVSKPADIRQETLPTLGITSQIGSATTTFAGSPTNRIYNIGVGADRFDGVLIKPGETFSFNEVLGDVGPETGYRPELVIKENKTVPEYGGGLCQVSTTMFRAAMNAGLPIVERTNHAYAVHYYAPIGMDATIYPPSPDMKFRNNTGHYVLVQTRHVGTSLTFDFFGTPDGRQANTEILYINASEASGGTAAFRYTVSGGAEPLSQTFTSTYKPQKDFPTSRSLN